MQAECPSGGAAIASEQAGETLEHQQSAVVVKAEGLGAQRVDAFACDRREMRQQRVSVDGIRIFLVAGEQEQALAVGLAARFSAQLRYRA